VVTEKMDGTLMTLYWYTGEWQVASQGKPEAGGKLTSHESIAAEKLSDEEFAKVPTFAQIFWRIFTEKGYKIPNENYKHYCFMFELSTPDTVIVVQHKVSTLRLHGVRNMTSLAEEEPGPFSELFCWEMVPSFDFKTKEEVVEAAKKLNAVEHEGFVCRDVHFNRVKVKNPVYVQISLLHSDSQGMDKRRMLAIIQLNEGEEFLTYFPKWKDLYNEQQLRIDTVVHYITCKFTVEFKNHSSDGKVYSAKVMNEAPKFSQGIFFKLRTEPQLNIREFLLKQSNRNLEEKFLIPFETEVDEQEKRKYKKENT